MSSITQRNCNIVWKTVQTINAEIIYCQLTLFTVTGSLHARGVSRLQLHLSITVPALSFLYDRVTFTLPLLLNLIIQFLF